MDCALAFLDREGCPPGPGVARLVVAFACQTPVVIEGRDLPGRFDASHTHSPMYQAHPSRVLTELFARRPYQGVSPETAKFLFVGLDANYAADVDQRAIFQALSSYHEDGPTFWREHGVHHPFLLDEYKGAGKRYHRTFAKIGFRPDHADLVSFAELLHVPTVGRSSLVRDDLDSSHLSRLEKAIFTGQARYVFLSAGVVRLMNATGQFPELEKASGPSGSLRTLYKDAEREVFLHLHFSNYGKFEARLQAEARAIAALLAPSDAQHVAQPDAPQHAILAGDLPSSATTDSVLRHRPDSIP